MSGRKQVGVHHPHKNIMTTDRPLELLHMDLFGPIAYISIDGSKYCLVIVDDYSRFTWVFFLQEKYHTQETLKGFLRRAQNEFGLRIKKIRSDNGTHDDILWQLLHPRPVAGKNIERIGINDERTGIGAMGIRLCRK